MRKFELLTTNGDKYFIHEGGEIERTDMAFTPSGFWRLLGLTPAHKTFRGIRREQHCEVVPLAELPALLEKGLQSLDEDGDALWTAVDYDHGSKRIWRGYGNGIREIRPYSGDLGGAR